MSQLQNLKIMLRAISITRERWLKAIDSKAKELMSEDLEISYGEAQKKAFEFPEIHEDYQNLIALYGMVGEQAEFYEGALESALDLWKKSA